MSKAKYQCKVCMTDFEELVLPERGKSEPVLKYMEMVQDLMGRAHSVRCDLMIPMSDKPDAGIGTP